MPEVFAPIVVAGSLNMDLVLEVPRMPAAGETLSARRFKRIPGGKGANQAVACARLRATGERQVAMIGCVGADDFGEQLRRALTADSVMLDHLSVNPAESTGTALIMVDDAGENCIVIVPGANATLTPWQLQQSGELIDRANLLLLQLEVPLATVEQAIQRAARAAVPVILNPAPAQVLPHALLSQVDYLVPNETEAALMTGIEVSDVASAAKAAAKLLDIGTRHVLLTLGAQGVLIVDGEGTRRHPAPLVQAVDTTAAGDTFIGGVAVALAEGRGLDDAVRFGIQAAALSVTRLGAQSSIPRRAELPGEFR